MEFEKVHADDRGEIYVVTGALPEDRELTLFTTKKDYARGGCIHRESGETAVVIKGSVRYFVKERRRSHERITTLSEGEIIHIPPNTPHFFVALTPETVVLEWGPKLWEKKEKDPFWRSEVDNINAENKKIRLNLGCGKRFIRGFVHIDLADHPHIDHRGDIGKLSMFENNSVDLIYCSHALQYFDREEAAQALEEWHRILKRGGVLRIAVTDFKAVVEVYEKYGDLNHQGILGPLYGKWFTDDIPLYMKTTYDFKSLKTLLESAGFKDVRRYDWRKTIHKDYDDYSQSYIPHMDKENGILISLNMEATK